MTRLTRILLKFDTLHSVEGVGRFGKVVFPTSLRRDKTRQGTSTSYTPRLPCTSVFDWWFVLHVPVLVVSSLVIFLWLCKC